MQGLAAITANNGWAMAAAGASIVLVGLTVLSLVISQLHKIIALLEKRKKPIDQDIRPSVPSTDLAAAEADILNDLAAAARVYKPLTIGIGESFSLTQLYEAFADANVPHPHITVRELRGAGYLTPVGEGDFSWKNV